MTLSTCVEKRCAGRRMLGLHTNRIKDGMMNIAEVMAETRKQAEDDSIVLKDMAEALRNGRDFLFSRTAMANMLDRLREDHVDHLT